MFLDHTILYEKENNKNLRTNCELLINFNYSSLELNMM